MFGDFNTNLAAPEGQDQDKRIAVDLEEEDLEDMRGQFLPCHKPRLKVFHVWAISGGGQVVRSRTSYIMYTDSHLFQNVSVWNM